MLILYILYVVGCGVCFVIEHMSKTKYSTIMWAYTTLLYKTST